MMTDVLIVTGPLNSAQLGVPPDAGYKVIHVHPKNGDLGSNAMGSAMANWLSGLPVREKVEKVIGEDLGKLGVAWFSAGHGAVRSILKTSVPSDVQAWLCIDGLYGSNAWAVDVSRAAALGKTSILATASTSTPGHYDHSLDRWRDVVKQASIPEQPVELASSIDLPEPDYCWSKGSCLVAGYQNLGHAKQVPAAKGSMLWWWEMVREGKIPFAEGGDSPALPPAAEPPSSFPIIGVALLIGVGSLAAYTIARR